MKIYLIISGSFTNEIRLDAREEYMYIAETTGQCISRMKVGQDGSLSGREVFGTILSAGLVEVGF